MEARYKPLKLLTPCESLLYRAKIINCNNADYPDKYGRKHDFAESEITFC